MAIKQPVLLGSYQFRTEDGTDTDLVDVITNVSADLYVALGSPVFDPSLLNGTVQENGNGQFTLPNEGTFNGKTVTLITDGVTPKGFPKTYQMQIPEYFPGYLLDRFLNSLAAPVENFVAFKFRGGRRIVIGSTIVT